VDKPLLSSRRNLWAWPRGHAQDRARITQSQRPEKPRILRVWCECQCQLLDLLPNSYEQKLFLSFCKVAVRVIPQVGSGAGKKAVHWQRGGSAPGHPAPSPPLLFSLPLAKATCVNSYRGGPLLYTNPPGVSLNRLELKKQMRYFFCAKTSCAAQSVLRVHVTLTNDEDVWPQGKRNK
jgi:hypothetical protein